jgi:hypothetical protein
MTTANKLIFAASLLIRHELPRGPGGTYFFSGIPLHI